MKEKLKSFIIGNRINILAEVYAHIGKHVELASWLTLSVSTLNTTVKNSEEKIK
jgi:hypothetical protein